MAFFNSAVTVLQTLVIALGAGLGIWGAINLLEGYGNDIRRKVPGYEAFNAFYEKQKNRKISTSYVGNLKIAHNERIFI